MATRSFPDENRPLQCRKPFAESLAEVGLYPLRATGIEVLQINLGRLCNQRCSHCHVDAGPDRHEIISRDTLQACLDAIAGTDVPLVDLTGGAPEMHPDFRWFAARVRDLDRRLIDRSNLTILMGPGYDDLPEFLADQHVEVVASLPCYLEENVDRQRGHGVFEKSLQALRKLNSLGYGRLRGGLELSLVYNPMGPTLPPPQQNLEADYRRELKSRYGIEFNRLFSITNLPIKRFLDSLIRNGQLEQYMATLVAAFNPQAAAGVMCRTTVSVDWTGRLFDCDFNQILELGLDADAPRNIREFDPDKLAGRRIALGEHCYACTAGAGSSCQGAITTNDE